MVLAEVQESLNLYNPQKTCLITEVDEKRVGISVIFCSYITRLLYAMKLNFHSENPKLHSKYKICKKATLEQSQEKENWSKRQTRKLMS